MEPNSSNLLNGAYLLYAGFFGALFAVAGLLRWLDRRR